MINLSDENIMDQIKGGKFELIPILFDRYNKQVLNYFYRSTSCLDDSEDLAQTVFLRLMKYAASYQQGTPFKYWFFKMAKNQLNQYFTQKNKDKTDRDKFISQTGNEILENPRESKDEDLFNAISKLPEEYRELIILSRFTQFSYSEIAEIHDTTEASIKNKLYRALIKLREIYFEISKTESYGL